MQHSNNDLPNALTIGAIQFHARPGQVEVNLYAAVKLIAEAAKKGADIIVLPELWDLGYGMDKPENYSEIIPGPITDFMSAQAKKHNLYVVGGIPERDGDGKCYDAAVLIDPKGVPILIQRKVHLYSTLGEDKTWCPGDRFEVVKTDIGRLGILIGYDGDFPESWRILALKGADLVLHIAAYESPCDEYGWWDKLYAAYSMVNAVWSVSANMVGISLDGKTHFFGWSRVLNPMGQVVAEAPHVRPGELTTSHVLVVKVPYARELEEGRKVNGCFLRDRRTGVYRANGL